MAVLAFVKSENVFLKIQEGTVDNLLDEDIDEGYVDYVLWSTFKPEDLGIDSELEMENIDSGQLMSKTLIDSAYSTIGACYRMAFDKKYNKKDVIIVANFDEKS